MPTHRRRQRTSAVSVALVAVAAAGAAAARRARRATNQIARPATEGPDPALFDRLAAGGNQLVIAVVLGAVGGLRIPPVQRCIAGFRTGARAADPGARAIVRYGLRDGGVGLGRIPPVAPASVRQQVRGLARPMGAPGQG